MHRPRALLALALTLSACSDSFDFKVDVEVLEDVDLAQGGTILIPAAYEEGELADATVVVSTAASSEQRSYSGSGETCCRRRETVNLLAFLDLDGNSRWDVGEPWGADPNNPVTLENDDYVGQVVIANDPAGP